jgi:uroporphyrin-III C-methyltransferase
MREPALYTVGNPVGIVYIVGAGPGAADLITVRGLRCLQRADVVVYDRLINAELLEEAPHAEQIYVGKTPGHHAHSQESINDILVREARRGRTVVRLKGGDPFVFGRGGEECLALADAGVPFEVVPGITSAVAVPAHAGIPVTHRGIASSFTVLTGHTAGDDTCAVDWEALPRRGTLIILMGLRNLPRIAHQLVGRGWASDTPVAVIASGTTAEQRVITGTLADIAPRVQGVPSPATIVVGDVVRLAEQIGWFHPQAPLPAFAAREYQAALAPAMDVPTADVPALEWRN